MLLKYDLLLKKSTRVKLGVKRQAFGNKLEDRSTIAHNLLIFHLDTVCMICITLIKSFMQTTVLVFTYETNMMGTESREQNRPTKLIEKTFNLSNGCRC